MVAKEEFFALAASAGVMVEYHPGGRARPAPGQPAGPYATEFMLDAPHGKIFASSGCHCDGSLSHDVDQDGTKTNWARALGGLRAILNMGLEDCPDRPECDQCDPIDP